MTREQAKSVLIKLGIAEPTDQQVSDYLNSFTPDIQKEKDKLNKYKEDAEKLKEAQAELEELKNKDLSEAEIARKELEKVQAQMETMKRESILTAVKATLNASGLDESDYKDFIDGFVSDDMEISKTRANAFIKTLEKTRKDTDTKLREELMDNTPGKDGKGGESTTPDTKTEAEKFVESMKVDTSSYAEGMNNYL